MKYLKWSLVTVVGLAVVLALVWWLISPNSIANNYKRYRENQSPRIYKIDYNFVYKESSYSTYFKRIMDPLTNVSHYLQNFSLMVDENNDTIILKTAWFKEKPTYPGSSNTTNNIIKDSLPIDLASFSGQLIGYKILQAWYDLLGEKYDDDTLLYFPAMKMKIKNGLIDGTIQYFNPLYKSLVHDGKKWTFKKPIYPFRSGVNHNYKAYERTYDKGKLVGYKTYGMSEGKIIVKEDTQNENGIINVNDRYGCGFIEFDRRNLSRAYFKDKKDFLSKTKPKLETGF